jgi:hypothetical protein
MATGDTEKTDFTEKTEKVGVTLTLGTIETIRRLAAANKISNGSAIAESVQINELLTKAEGQQAKILLKYPDGRMEEVVRQPL